MEAPSELILGAPREIQAVAPIGSSYKDLLKNSYKLLGELLLSF